MARGQGEQMDDAPVRWLLPRNQRLPAYRYETIGRPCGFTVRTAPGTAPFVRPALARLAVQCLLEQRITSGCQLEVYCVMPDHLHIVVTTADDGTSSLRFVDRFKGWYSRVARQAGAQGPLWQPRSYDHVIRTHQDLHRVADYIMANPIRRGLCDHIEEYPWSGIPQPIAFAPP